MATLVAAGSSSIDLWTTIKTDLAPITVIENGVSGQLASQLLANISTLVTSYSPDKVLLYIGENDIAAGTAPATVAATIEDIWQAIFASLPNAKVYVISLKPSVSRWSWWDEMQTCNGLVYNYASSEPRVIWMDTSTSLLSGGSPNPDYYQADQLHLSFAGYVVWTRIIQPLVNGITSWARVALSSMRKPGYAYGDPFNWANWSGSFALNDDTWLGRNVNSTQRTRAQLSMSHYADKSTTSPYYGNAFIGGVNENYNEVSWVPESTKLDTWTRLTYWNHVHLGDTYGVNHATGWIDNTRVMMWDVRIYIKRKSTGQWYLHSLSDVPGGEIWSPDFDTYGGSKTGANADYRIEASTGYPSVRLVYDNVPEGGYWMWHGYSGLGSIDPNDVAHVLVSSACSLVLHNSSLADDRQYSRFMMGVGADYYPASGNYLYPAVGTSRARFVTAQWPNFEYRVMHTMTEAELNAANGYPLECGLLPPEQLTTRVTTPSTQPPAKTGKRWYPGHYYQISDDIDRTSLILEHRRNVVKTHPHWIGYKISCWWHMHEPSKGVYDFSRVIAMLDTAHADGKKVWIQLCNRSFHGTARGQFCPQYIISDYNGVYYDTSTAENFAGPKLWEPAIKERWELYLRAFLRATRDHPALQGWETEEGNMAACWLQPGWSVAAHNQHILDQARIGAEEAGECLFDVNIAWSVEDLDDTAEHYRITDTIVRTYKTGFCPNDLAINSFARPTGTTYGKYCFDRYRGEGWFAINIEWLAHFDGVTPKQLVDHAIELGCHFITWIECYSTSATFTTDDAVAYVDSIGGLTATAKPSVITYYDTPGGGGDPDGPPPDTSGRLPLPSLGQWFAKFDSDTVFAAPTSDISAGAWTSTGANLYSVLDESTPSSSDYVSCGTMGSEFEVKLAAMSDPGNHANHGWAVMASGIGKTLTTKVVCGTTVIATRAVLLDSNSDKVFNFEMTEAEAVLITNYADLRIRGSLS